MDRICPLLAMASDRRTVCDGYDPNHRCWSDTAPPTLDRTQQLDVCLTAAHASCPYLQPAVGSEDHGVPIDQRIGSSRLVVEPAGAWHGLTSRSAVSGPGRRAALAGVAVLIVGGLASASGGLGGLSAFAADLQRASVLSVAAERVAPEVVAMPTPSPTLEATPSPEPAALPSVVLTPPPTQSVVLPSPTTAPTEAATPAPPVVQRYVVQSGDTLSSIADRFGVSVQALQQANGIADQNVISVGQTLIIPT